MKKKTLLIICCFVSACFAQTPDVFPQDTVMHELLSPLDFLDTLHDDDATRDLPETRDALNSAVARVHDLVDTLGVQAFLTAVYISERCSESYAWFRDVISLYTKKHHS